jgi:hypothetical protein
MRKRNTLALAMVVVLVAVFCTGAGIASAAKDAVLVIVPEEGVPGDKLVFVGCGFEKGEKVRVILNDGDVPYAFGVAGTGGVVTVKENGTFVLQPRGGIPKVMSGAGTYVVEAIGDRGTKATAELKVLEKE